MLTKVLFLHSGGDWVRGSENALLTAMHGLDKGVVSSSLLTSNSHLMKLASEHGIQSDFCPMPEIMIDGFSIKLQIVRWLRAFFRIVSYIKQNDIQVLYCNGGSTSQVGHYAGKYCGIPVVVHLHSPYTRRYILLYRFHKASKVVFVSKSIENTIRGKQPFEGQCEVIYNGVDTNRFQKAAVNDSSWRVKLEIPVSAVVFGQVSSLITRKGIDILLRAYQLALQKNPNLRLVLVGEGPDRAQFAQLADELEISKCVVWTGNQTDPLPYYQHVFDVNVLASRSDAFPLSTLEAASCGLPSIGANVDGIPEGVIDGRTGLIFPGGDFASLAEKMLLLAADSSLRAKLGEEASRIARERFSMSRYCQSIQKVILEQVQDASAFAHEGSYVR